MALHKITIMSKPGCKLCDEAKNAVLKLVSTHTDVLVEEVNILDQPDLHAKYKDAVPVLLVDGVERFRGRIDPDALARLFYDELGQKLIGFS